MDSTDSEGNEVLQEKIKVPKHLIEKRRRARINSCLGELKTLVIEKDFLKGHRSSKLEKADILELTVEYLKRKAKLPYPVLETSGISDIQTKLYARGYRECLDQVSHHIKSTGIEQSVGDALLNELQTVAEKMISKDAKMTDKHLKSAYADDKSQTGFLTKLSRSGCSEHAMDYVALEEKTQFGTHNHSKEHFVNEKVDHNFQILPNSKNNVDHKCQMASSTSCNSISMVTDKAELPSASIKIANEQTSICHVDPHSNVPSMYPMVGSLQSVTVLVPCQVLASAIPPITMNQYQSLGHFCEHAESGRSFLSHSVCPTAVSVNPGYVSINTVPRSDFENNKSNVVPESLAVSKDPFEGKYDCSYESVPPLQSPWRPW